jgi:replicative DNA helicase
VNSPANTEAERNVLGCVLLSPKALDSYSEMHIRAEHFWTPKHGSIFDAMLALSDRGEPVDSTTVRAELGRLGADVDPAYLEALAAVPTLSNHRAYGRIVKQDALLRRKFEAGRDIQQAAAARDSDALADAEGRLIVTEERRDSSTPEQLAQEIYRELEEGEEMGWRWPLRALDVCTAGLLPGELTVIGGYTSHGKSTWLDQVLIECRKQGARVHLYILEMTRRQRAKRQLAYLTGVPFGRLRDPKRLTTDDRAKVVQALGSLPFGITNAKGWTAAEIARDIRRNRWDVCGVDILHSIEYEGEEGIRHITNALQGAALVANSHVLATSHLNEKKGSFTGIYPPPWLGDLKGGSSLKQDPDNVMFVWRKQEDPADDGPPTVLNEGAIYFAKVRNGEEDGVKVVFNGAGMRFTLPMLPGTVGVAA